jgi:hypothetical protein
MNIFELGFVTITVAGGIAGAIIGYGIYGVCGAALGTIGGAAAGLAFAGVAIFVLAVVCKLAFGGPLFKPRKPPTGA